VTARILAGLLILGALLVYMGVALPMHRAAAATGDDYRRARDARRTSVTRLAQAERREAARRAALQLVAPPEAGSEKEALSALRRSVIASLSEARVSNVRLNITPGRPPVRASLQLSAEGEFQEIVRLSGQIARPGSGLTLDRVRLNPTASGVNLELEGLSLGASR
jgi:hypothetical protein